MEAELRPIRERAAEVRARETELDEILAAGAARARSVASVTLHEVKHMMGLS
jgi:tryptophanyl-tRNA synthetase